jgi:hypothetical protein
MAYDWLLPDWCHRVSGRDALFFAQPTIAFVAGGPLWLAPADEAAARCGLASAHGTPPGDHRDPQTIWVQCGQLAQLCPDGTYLCETHFGFFWLCDWCGGPLPENGKEGGIAFCSPACAAADAQYVQYLHDNAPDDDLGDEP